MQHSWALSTLFSIQYSCLFSVGLQATMQQERVFLQKMNLTLVYVLKQEWPHNWPEFIAEIVQASTTNEVSFRNALRIIYRHILKYVVCARSSHKSCESF